MDEIYSVSEITHRIKNLLEYQIPDFYLEGEISEIKYHSSGHIYFSLKDNKAIIPAAMWRSQASSLITRPQAGAKVICRGKLSVYAPQGRYQFIAASIKTAGQGDLFLQFEALKKRLETDGLFDQENKSSLPDFPRHIAIITSESAAALQDMLGVFRKSAPHIKLSIFPARVQGEGSAKQIISALNHIENDLKSSPDCIIIARGGGSIEDLWEFNSEALARRIHSCKTPIISGVGHETDFTICDFVADHRASTPTAAAEFCCRSWLESREILDYLDSRISKALENSLTNKIQQLNNIVTSHGFRRHSDILKTREDQLRQISKRINTSASYTLQTARQKLSIQLGKIKLLDPVQILKRGFSINRDSSGKIIKSISQLRMGDTLISQFHDGSSESKISNLRSKNSHGKN